jgi:prohibitin 1
VINSVTGTKDLQMVNISLRVLSRPVEERLPEIFSKIGIDFDERVLPGVGNEVLKAVVVSALGPSEAPLTLAAS